MYTKQELKQLRKDFWDQFKTWSGYKRARKGKKGRWLMNETGIKQVKLKFHFDEHLAYTGIEIDTRNREKRTFLWHKLESLRKLLDEKAGFPLDWEKDSEIEGPRKISRIYSRLNEVSIYNRKDWKAVNDFFYQRMSIFEDFFLEYRDSLKH